MKFEIEMVVEEAKGDRAALTVEAYNAIREILDKIYGAWYEEENLRQEYVGGTYFYDWTAYVVDHDKEEGVAIDISEGIYTATGKIRIYMETRDLLDEEELEWLAEMAEVLGNDEDAELVREILERSS